MPRTYTTRSRSREKRGISHPRKRSVERRTSPTRSIKSGSLSPTSSSSGAADEDDEEDEELTGLVTPVPRTRKRDIVRRLSWQLIGHAQSMAGTAIQSIFRGRLRDAEAAQVEGHHIDITVPPSRRNHTESWETKDDIGTQRRPASKPFEEVVQERSSGSNFFLSRITDPTSYFYKYRFEDQVDEVSKHSPVYLVDIKWLKPHEEIVSNERVAGLRRATIRLGAYTQPLLVDADTGAILDGHHRHRVGIQMQLKRLPAVLVHYLTDESITVDVWPECEKESLTKKEVLDMSLSKDVFPPKTSRHRFVDKLKPISVPLQKLREDSDSMDWERIGNKTRARVSSFESLKQASVDFFTGAQNFTTSALDVLFRSRVRTTEHLTNGASELDIVSRPCPSTDDAFTRIRRNDDSSSFGRNRSLAFEDLFTSDRKQFFMTRIADPTSYFYKYRYDTTHKREAKRQTVELVEVSWLKPHEQVVSWERVEGLKRATLQWDAYIKPLLVDRKTGSILDGHHRYNVGILLKLRYVPAVLVDYLADDSITVDVWPDCGLNSITKEEVIEKSLSPDVYPPKTTRHAFSDDMPPVSIPLARLRGEATQ